MTIVIMKSFLSLLNNSLINRTRNINKFRQSFSIQNNICSHNICGSSYLLENNTGLQNRINDDKNIFVGKNIPSEIGIKSPRISDSHFIEETCLKIERMHSDDILNLIVNEYKTLNHVS